MRAPDLRSFENFGKRARGRDNPHAAKRSFVEVTEIAGVAGYEHLGARLYGGAENRGVLGRQALLTRPVRDGGRWFGNDRYRGKGVGEPLFVIG